jgi:hypothetical protein
MPKVYFCTKVVDFKTCGETNPDNFPSGRYSTCKTCRNKNVRDYNKEKKILESEESNKKTDPSHNIRNLIIDTINYTPIVNGKSVYDKFQDIDYDVTDVLNKCTNDLDEYKKQMNKEFTKLMEEIKELKKEIFDLKNSK